MFYSVKVVSFIGMERFRRDLQLLRRMKRHPSKARAVRSERLKTRSKIEVSTLARIGGRGWGLYRRLGRWRGATWSKEQGKTNGFEFGVF